jgi:multiple antibiotic resistance protein
MLEIAFKAFTTFFATIGPIEAAVLFAGLAPSLTQADRRIVAWKATAIATLILAFFAVAGQLILNQLGVSVAALQAAGGIILFIIALDLVFLWQDQPTANITPSETREALHKDDIAIFPLATPMLAGPGAMSGAILMMSSAGGVWQLQAGVMMALVVVMGLTLAFLLAAKDMHRLIGLTAQKVVQRVFGILLAALAMQSLFNGIAASGIFAR